MQKRSPYASDWVSPVLHPAHGPTGAARYMTRPVARVSAGTFVRTFRGRSLLQSRSNHHLIRAPTRNGARRCRRVTGWPGASWSPFVRSYSCFRS